MGRLGAAGWLTGVYRYTQKRSAHHLGSEVEVHSSIQYTYLSNREPLQYVLRYLNFHFPIAVYLLYTKLNSLFIEIIGVS